MSSEGLQAYSEYQVAREEEPLEPGEAFPLVHKLLRLNERLGADSRVEVVLLSRNSADTGLRVFNSIQHYKLDISRAAFCGGESPWRYINAFGCQLFLSNEAEDVRYALDCGVAAATLVSSKGGGTDSDLLRFAFDGDAVLFSDEAERVYQSPKGWRHLPPVSRPPPGSPSPVGHSSRFWRPCTGCSRLFPPAKRPSAPPW